MGATYIYFFIIFDVISALKGMRICAAC